MQLSAGGNLSSPSIRVSSDSSRRISDSRSSLASDSSLIIEDFLNRVREVELVASPTGSRDAMTHAHQDGGWPQVIASSPLQSDDELDKTLGPASMPSPIARDDDPKLREVLASTRKRALVADLSEVYCPEDDPMLCGFLNSDNGGDGGESKKLKAAGDVV